MEISLAQKAIDLALEGRWQEAIKVNLELLKLKPKDIDSLNRLARAYAELGNIAKAKAYAREVLNIDPANTIAQKCLGKWKAVRHIDQNPGIALLADSFLEESGKTKLVNLLNLGDKKILANLDPGEEVKMDSHAHRISIMTSEDKYIGRLPDDLSARLRSLIKAGNTYQVLIKSVEPREVVVFIRELTKGKAAETSLSFPPEKIDYVSFTPPELVHKDTPEVTDIGEEEL